MATYQDISAPTAPERRCGRTAITACGGGGALLLVVVVARVLIQGRIVVTAADAALDYKGPLLYHAGVTDEMVSPLRDVLPRQPLRDNFRRWGGSVAVVSSSGTLVGSGLGPLIDSHDIVVRFNYAPCRGYEEDVGTRTDVRLLGKNHMFWEDEHERVIHRYNTRPYMLADVQLMSELENPRTNRLYAIHNRFHESMAKQLHGSGPSSGFVGVMFALYEFRNVSLFGFTKMNLRRAVADRKYHYFDNAANFDGPVRAFHRRYNLSDDSLKEMALPIEVARHRMDVEWDLYDLFESQGRVNRYPASAAL